MCLPTSRNINVQRRGSKLILLPFVNKTSVAAAEEKSCQGSRQDAKKTDVRSIIIEPKKCPERPALASRVPPSATQSLLATPSNRSTKVTEPPKQTRRPRRAHSCEGLLQVDGVTKQLQTVDKKQMMQLRFQRLSQRKLQLDCASDKRKKTQQRQRKLDRVASDKKMKKRQKTDSLQQSRHDQLDQLEQEIEMLQRKMLQAAAMMEGTKITTSYGASVAPAQFRHSVMAIPAVGRSRWIA